MSSQYVRTQLLLRPETRAELVDIARREERSLSDVVREMIRRELAHRRKREMAEAAQVLLSDYQTDEELTAFTALDGDDVYT